MIIEIKEKLKQRNIFNIIMSVVAILGSALFCYLAGYSLIIPLLFLFVGIHLNFFGKAHTKIFVHLGLLVALLIFITHAIGTYWNISEYYIPVAGIVILTTLLFNDIELSFVMAFVSSIAVSIILKGDFGMMITFFVGSLIGAYSVRGARTRGQLITAGLFVSAIHVVCLILLYPDLQILSSKVFSSNKIYPLIASGFISTFFVAATLKVFEYLFGVLTNYSLLELSDFNQPLLKRMILEAPGTYHHSLVVSNLSESAADAIDANSLLTRVGAYYHDIGKMIKPEYFTENQMLGGNKHDNIEPSMSRLVILNHVKEGIELAKKNNLNQMIIDFISQHHGTSMMYYFYQKSLETTEDKENTKEEDYRYPGPRPQRRETAIVMLADSVEAAVRSLDEASPARIEETVKKIMNNKFIDGQLDECNLTLKEIDKISSTFIRILSAMYHGRAKYPEKNNGSNSRKSSEENKSKTSPDSQNRKNNSSS
ncbi:MAG: HDIG domain-containing protein [Candidatus Zapsychrus exili]|nr:HDIG domain-containing protein [Candidatus Zapsychrus exili]